MANRTDPAARSVHGTDPQNLVEKIVRSKIYHNPYWKEQCFGLTAETLVDRAMELDHIGGTYGGTRKPTRFICLILKMLQIQPEKEIVVEFIKNEDYKYVRVLGALYMRMVGKPVDVYRYLEPLYNDYRKLRRKLRMVALLYVHVDEFIDELLRKDYACDVALARMPRRLLLEETGQLEPRKSVLEDDFQEEEEAAAAAKEESQKMEDMIERGRRREKERDYDSDRRLRHRERREDHRGRGGDGYYRSYERERERYGSDRHRYRDVDYRRGRDYDHVDGRERRRERHDEEREYRSRRQRRSASRGEKRKQGGGHVEEERRTSSKRRKQREEEKKEGAVEGDGTDHADPEIAEANRLRKSLGLKPLKL